MKAKNCRKIRACIRNIVFLILLFVMLKIGDFTFAQTGYVRYVFEDINAEEENYDLIILGASHTRAAINPKYLDEKLGVNAYNAAIPGETIEDSYYTLRSVLKHNKVKTVILDVDYQYWMHKQPTSSFSKSFIYCGIEDADVKAEYVWNNRSYMDIRNLFTRRFSWNCSVSSAKKNFRLKTSQAYKENDISSAGQSDGKYVEGADGPYVGKGYFYRNVSGKVPSGKKYRDSMIGAQNRKFDENVLTYYRKIVRLCKNNNIRLICVTSPITPSSVEVLGMEVMHERFKKMFAADGLEYYDFNLALMSVIPRDDACYGDLEGHMGGMIGNIYSEALASLLADVQKGTYDESRYFYSSFGKMYGHYREDYVKATGKNWVGY